MTNKINGLIKITSSLLVLYELYHFIFVVVFPQKDIDLLCYSILLMGNYSVYFFISGLRQYRSQQPKFRLLYFASLPLSAAIIYFSSVRFAGWPMKTFFSDNENIFLFINFVVAIYAIIVDTYYQLRRKNNHQTQTT